MTDRLRVHVPADLAVLLLHQEATRTGDMRLRIKTPTLRQWVRRGHITYNRGAGGYDVASIITYVTGRTGRGHRRTRPAPSEQDAA